jgi:hypothetical protein
MQSYCSSSLEVLVKYTPRLSLPAPSLFGLPFRQKALRLKKAGFTGIELFLFPPLARRLNKYRAVAKEYGLCLSLHQPWSESEASGLSLNKKLRLIGYLPREGYRIDELTEEASGELFVAYCDRLDEVLEMQKSNNCPVCFSFQTACVWSGEYRNRTHRLPYSDFEGQILRSAAPIVFDTFHLLEWRYGKASGANLASISPNELAEELIRIWRQIGPDRIIEIHWNDFVASAEGGGEDGRCLPGDGLLREGLSLLAKEIKCSGWNGMIIPELSPFLLFPYRTRTLIALRERMEQFFV